MTRLRLTHPSELLFALLTRGTVAGVAVAVLCIVILELREYTVITFLYGVPFVRCTDCWLPVGSTPCSPSGIGAGPGRHAAAGSDSRRNCGGPLHSCGFDDDRARRLGRRRVPAAGRGARRLGLSGRRLVHATGDTRYRAKAERRSPGPDSSSTGPRLNGSGPFEHLDGIVHRSLCPAGKPGAGRVPTGRAKPARRCPPCPAGCGAFSSPGPGRPACRRPRCARGPQGAAARAAG